MHLATKCNKYAHARPVSTRFRSVVRTEGPGLETLGKVKTTHLERTLKAGSGGAVLPSVHSVRVRCRADRVKLDLLRPELIRTQRGKAQGPAPTSRVEHGPLLAKSGNTKMYGKPCGIDKSMACKQNLSKTFAVRAQLQMHCCPSSEE